MKHISPYEHSWQNEYTWKVCWVLWNTNTRLRWKLSSPFHQDGIHDISLLTNLNVVKPDIEYIFFSSDEQRFYKPPFPWLIHTSTNATLRMSRLRKRHFWVYRPKSFMLSLNPLSSPPPHILEPPQPARKRGHSRSTVVVPLCHI